MNFGEGTLDIDTISVRDLNPGHHIVGLGRVQSVMEGGKNAQRTLTAFGEDGWRVIWPIGRGRYDVDVVGF